MALRCNLSYVADVLYCQQESHGRITPEEYKMYSHKTIAPLLLEDHAELTSRYPGVTDPVPDLEHS